MMITVPLKLSGSFASASSIASSPSKQIAVPSNLRPSFPVIFATEPSGARSPYRIWMCPDFLIGSLMGRSTSWPSTSGRHSSRFCARVLPVTVMQSPSMTPSSMRYLSTAGVPPTLCTSSMTYLPLGLRSAMNGMRSEHAWKSSRVRVMPAARAIAMRWSTALVEPPRAMTVTIAFSNAVRVMMSRGLRSFSSMLRTAAPALKHSTAFRGSSAGTEELYGRVIPSASIAVAMVLAVYMPPQAPAPGHELRTMAKRSSSVIFPATYCP
mmetsp:Transcript_721/g.2356  ORF Transcript_721/g.2356 Transcript_721/m.2356 type:complete len:267 (-) Transcript_721:643-1443(-)